LEAAQKAATDAQTAPTNPSQSSGDEEASGAPDSVEKPAPTPDYAAGLIPNNPPPTPLAAPPTPQPPLPPSIPTLTPLKANTMASSVRPPAQTLGVIAPPASPGGPQIVRIVTPGTNPSLTTPAVYRLVQPTNATGQTVPVSTISTSAQPAAPPKKSVALMLTVSFQTSSLLGNFRHILFIIFHYLNIA
jgi:hypothetical protein